MESCIKSGTVKRLIYTASVIAASPLKEDGKGLKHRLDESCWTSKDVVVPYINEFLMVNANFKILFCHDEINRMKFLELVYCRDMQAQKLLPRKNC